LPKHVEKSCNRRGRGRLLDPRRTASRWEAPVGVSFLYLPLHEPAESDSAHSRSGHSANFRGQAHLGVPETVGASNSAGEATFFWKSDPGLDTPDLQTCQVEVPMTAAEMIARFNTPAASWTKFGGIVRPDSRGRIRLTGPNPLDPVQIETNMMSHPDDLRAAMACVQLCREIGNSAAFRPFVKREVMPGNLKGAALENFIPDSVVTYCHQTQQKRSYTSNCDGNFVFVAMRFQAALRPTA
jgi:choline dehydrogenase-like flavoprotein